MIRLSPRFDDPSAISDHVLEEGVFAAAESAGIRLTVAVIPFRQQEGDLIPLSREGATYLIDAQRAGVIEVAQHRHCHESACGEKKPPGEFMGVNPASQTEWIWSGQMLLETVFDKPIIGFVPPWSTFDYATTHALEVFASLDPVVNVVMHHYDFSESGNPQTPTDLNRFRAQLQTLNGDERVQTITLSNLAGEPLAHRTSRQRQNAWAKLPWKIFSCLPKNALLNLGWTHLPVRSLFRSK
jgi:hypothetical protein